MERMDVSLKVRSTNYVLGLKLGVIVKNINEETSRVNIGPLDTQSSDVGNMDFFFEPAKNGSLPVAVIGMHHECAGEPIWFTIESDIPCEFLIALANEEGTYDTVVGEMKGPVKEMTFSLNDLLYPGQSSSEMAQLSVSAPADDFGASASVVGVSGVDDVYASDTGATASIDDEPGYAGEGMTGFPGMSTTPIRTMVDAASQTTGASDDVGSGKQAS